MSGSWDALVAGVRLPSLRRFLLGSGWARVRSGAGFELFRLIEMPAGWEGGEPEDGEPQALALDGAQHGIEVVLPTLSIARDYQFRMQELIATLAQIYRVSPESMAQEIGDYLDDKRCARGGMRVA